MILTERIEMMIVGILGVFGVIALYGIIIGNTQLLALVTGIVGALAGYLGNQLKGQLMNVNEPMDNNDEV